MRLAHPVFLALILPAVILAVLALLNWINREASLKFSSVQIVREAGARQLSLRRLVLTLVRLAALGVLIFALARPQTGEGKTEESREVIDVMISLDISSSMATLDFNPENRLTAAKQEAERFIQKRPHDRIGLVVFSKNAITISPLTTDHKALSRLLSRVEMGMMEDGTAIGVGLATAASRLRESEAKSKVIVLMTDGVNNSGEIDPKTAGDIAHKLGIKVYAIGVGTDGQAMVPIDDPRTGTRRLIQTYTEIDEKLLTEIAKKTGGLYFRAKDETGLRSIFNEVNKLEKTEVKVNTFTTYDEHYAKYLGWALWILVAEFLLRNLVWRKMP
jgi:Ca-activated chloride channel family protein